MAQDTTDTYSCYRRFAGKVNADEWLNLVEARSVTDLDLYHRLKSNWSAVGGVSGLVSGFMYIASNNDINFTQNGPHLWTVECRKCHFYH